MSEEFLRVAKKEILDDLNAIRNLLKNCTGDSDVLKNAAEIQQKTHKIKGLAPMMNHQKIGLVASYLDDLLKSASAGKAVLGLYHLLKKSVEFMNSELEQLNAEFDSLKEELEKTRAQL